MNLFVSYAHDPEGQTAAQLIVQELRKRHFRVSWDNDDENPASIHEWMERKVRSSIVICVVTKSYCESFEGGSDCYVRKGVLYEARAIMQKLHDHTLDTDCPVIPVRVGSAARHRLPAALQRLVIAEINYASHQGFDELADRIRALSNSSREPIANVPEPCDYQFGPAEAEYRCMLRKLESAERGTVESREAVLDWLRCCAHHQDVATALLAPGLTYAERIVDSLGDLSLMRKICDTCLPISDRPDGLLGTEVEFRARVLVYCLGWCLQREHRFREALNAIEEGVELARRIRDRKVEAAGKKALGQLWSLIAADMFVDTGIAAHLEYSIALMNDAKEMFSSLEGKDSEEVGACLGLEGRCWLTFYRLTRQASQLVRARDCAMAAASIVGAGHYREYAEVVILLAEISIEHHRYASASDLLNKVIGQLSKRPDTRHGEILAQALRVRGVVLGKMRSRTEEGLGDLNEAEQLFAAIGQNYAAEACYWERVRVCPSMTGISRLTQEDLDALESLESDPRRRRQAMDLVYDDEQSRGGILIGYHRRPNWSIALRRLDSGR